MTDKPKGERVWVAGYSRDRLIDVALTKPDLERRLRVAGYLFPGGAVEIEEGTLTVKPKRRKA